MPPIENVSDTARWVAIYRAMESERPDAIFRDPFARRLAGERGEEIVATLKQGRATAWAMIVRTAIFDEIIRERVASGGVDLVVYLAAGLDARPWRLELPASLRWVDVDFPPMIEYKTALLRGETPRCRYEAIPADLTNAAVRDALFTQLGASASRVLVISEGLLVYLDAEQVKELARALHAVPTFRWWLADVGNQRLLKMLQKQWGSAMDRAPMKFGVDDLDGFFGTLGWRVAQFRSAILEARRLRREMRMGWFVRFMMRISPREKRKEVERMSGFVLFERT
ncbi:MAG: class I SAM-dependent methyltransferase [Gemmatimonadaceae bacterium]|nr:class I SAM-dependent methyltransferase [Gemmatimonadaceae bacterium]NUQ91501.1 class I SAM-dependent methyltransferase [Gemmatimonadaceae bacterium]NUR33932.1 class I SAM-dependent methyltransferase [Gemmatimonadaceae bacterium]NUS98355.1 class I SAM-dependent methyltransferase [Gemmatimonadaceae bacterium]